MTSASPEAYGGVPYWMCGVDGSFPSELLLRGRCATPQARFGRIEPADTTNTICFKGWLRLGKKVVQIISMEGSTGSAEGLPYW